jgi:hypothetical protein
VSQIGKRQKKFRAGYAVVMVAAAAGCFFHPDDKAVALPLATFFGPFLVLRLGMEEAPWIVFGLVLPFAWKTNALTSALLFPGIVGWAGCGLVAGAITQV